MLLGDGQAEHNEAYSQIRAHLFLIKHFFLSISIFFEYFLSLKMTFSESEVFSLLSKEIEIDHLEFSKSFDCNDLMSIKLKVRSGDFNGMVSVFF